MSTALPIDKLTRVIRTLPGGGLSAARQAALAAFAERGFPTIREEDWKYTDLAHAIEISRDWLMAGAPVDAPDSSSIRAVQDSIDAHWLVVANGTLAAEHSDVTGLAGLTVEPVTVPDTGFDAPLSDLNAALSHGTIEVTVSRAWQDEKPIVLLFADSTAETPATAHARVDLRLEPSSSARFVEYHLSTGRAAHYSNVHARLDVGANADCRYLRLQDRALHHSQTARLIARLDRDARLAHFGMDLGGSLVRNDLKVDIEGRNASAVLNGVYLAGPGQHVDNHTRTEHRVGPARSRQEYRGVLAGRCRAVWNGKAVVHPGADGTDAEQANHNLLLSEHAEIDAKPELEIYADDVKCAHGTTVGHLDERALFYLRSRGIGPERAKRMLTRAFAAAVVDSLPIDGLRGLVGDMVEARLRAIAAGDAA